MNTRSFAQSSTRFQPNFHIVRLACSPGIALQAWWLAEAERRRRLVLVRELRKMSDHTLRDIGVSRFANGWIARHDA